MVGGSGDGVALEADGAGELAPVTPPGAGLLQGVGKVSKHVKLKMLKDVKQTALRYYIKQALKLDQR